MAAYIYPSYSIHPLVLEYNIPYSTDMAYYLENPKKICFITNEIIPEKDLSIDHIIPWSYMYSDDLWNLVYVNKSVNSSMSNRVKQDDIKDKLIKRNKRLIQILDTKKITNKEVEELRLAINKDYVELFWIGYQG